MRYQRWAMAHMITSGRFTPPLELDWCRLRRCFSRIASFINIVALRDYCDYFAWWWWADAFATLSFLPAPRMMIRGCWWPFHCRRATIYRPLATTHIHLLSDIGASPFATGKLGADLKSRPVTIYYFSPMRRHGDERDGADEAASASRCHAAGHFLPSFALPCRAPLFKKTTRTWRRRHDYYCQLRFRWLCYRGRRCY